MGFTARNEPVYGTGSTAIRESAPGFAVHLVEVEIDEVTGETRPVRYVAVQDVGFAINPAEVEAQIHGGVAQGLGWALYEGMVYDSEGQLLTATLMDYALPRAEMVPPIETVLVEVPSEHGAYGAKGIGEPPAIPGAAAVANAIRDVTGRRILSIPDQAGNRGRGALGAVHHVGGRLMPRLVLRIMSASILSAAYGGELWSPRVAAMTEDMASTWGDWGVSSEIGRLHAVLLRRPGPELDAVTDFNAMQMRSDSLRTACASNMTRSPTPTARPASWSITWSEGASINRTRCSCATSCS